MPSSRRSPANFPRSSARSIEAAGVPRTGNPAASRSLRHPQRRLPAELADHADRPFGLAHRQDVLGRQRLEVQARARVVVGRDGLRVRVDHHGLEPRLAERERRVHARVVELDPLSDAVGTGPQDHHARTFGRSHLVLLLVGRVVVRGPRGELARARVDRLEHGADAERRPASPDLRLGRGREDRQPAVGQPDPLGPLELGGPERPEFATVERRDLLDHLRDLVDEPRVDPTGERDLLHRAPAPQRRLDEVQAVLARRGDRLEEAVDGAGQRARRRAAEVGVGTLERAPGLAQRLLEGAADRHHLAHGLHRRVELRVGLGELLEREPRHLHHDVVERRLERGERHAGDVVGDLVERVPDGEQRRDLGDREPRRLRGQRGRTRDARVHLDQDLAAGARVDRELDVRAAGLDPDRADARERRVAHPLVLAVGQRHHRRHRDRVAGVHAHRVDVLDRADHDGVVRAVAHHLELELLPAGDRLLDEDLGHRARGEAAARDALELGPGAGEPAPAPAEGERRAGRSAGTRARPRARAPGRANARSPRAASRARPGSSSP